MAVKEGEVVEEKDEYSEAFGEATEKGGEEETPTEDLEPELEGEGEETPTSEEGEEKPVEKEETPKVEEKAEELTVEERLANAEKELEDTKHRESTLQGMYNSELKKKDKAPEKEEPISEEPEEEEDFTPVTEGMSKQIGELDSVKALKEEYGDDIEGALNDVAGLVTKTVMADVSKRLKNQFGEVEEKIAPLQSQHAQSGRDAFDNSVISEHPDYSKYVESGELKTWVESQTGLNGKAFQAAYSDGDNQDVIELVAAFREAKGYVEEKQEVPVKKEKEIDTSKLEDMEVVESKKTPVSGRGKGAVDMNDFGGAFREATKT